MTLADIAFVVLAVTSLVSWYASNRLIRAQKELIAELYRGKKIDEELIDVLQKTINAMRAVQ